VISIPDHKGERVCAGVLSYNTRQRASEKIALKKGDANLLRIAAGPRANHTFKRKRSEGDARPKLATLRTEEGRIRRGSANGMNACGYHLRIC